MGVGIGWAGTASAIQPLEQFIGASSTQDYEARALEATQRQREAEADVSLGRILPSGTARGVYTRNQYEIALSVPGTAPRLIQPQNQLDAFLEVDVPLVDLASYYRFKSARSVARASGEQLAAGRLEAARGVARAYFQILGGVALIDSATKSVAAAEVNLKNVEDRRAAGTVTDLDLERARANVERARKDVADAELTVSLASRTLETLSGISPTPAAVPPPADLREEAPLARWQALVGETPQARAARELSAASSQAKTASDLALLPTLTAIGQERFTNATGFLGRSSYYSLQLALSWRLDYGTMKARDAQDAAQEVSEIRQQQVARAVADTVYEAYQRVTNGIARCRAARAEAAAASKAAELAADRYGAGVATQLDVTQAQRDAFLADASRIQADAELALARATLRLAVGRDPTDRRSP